jgi:hypothetical protein
VIPRTPEQAVALGFERLDGRRVAGECPICQSLQQVILEWDGFALVGQCNYCHATGSDILMALGNQTAPSNGVAPIPTRKRIPFHTVDQLLKLAPPDFLVEPYITRRGITMLFGRASTYKTYAAIDWAARAPCPAAYISAEGSPRRFGERVRAWERSAGRPSDIHVHPSSIDLVEDVGVLTDELERLPERVGLVVLDTLSRNLGGTRTRPRTPPPSCVPWTSSARRSTVLSS